MSDLIKEMAQAMNHRAASLPYDLRNHTPMAFYQEIAASAANIALKAAADKCIVIHRSKKIEQEHYDNAGDKETASVCAAQASTAYVCGQTILAAALGVQHD